MGGLFKKFVEWGTECKYVPLGSCCGACNKKIGFFASGFCPLVDEVGLEICGGRGSSLRTGWC